MSIILGVGDGLVAPRLFTFITDPLNVNQTNTDLVSLVLPSAKCIITRFECFAGTGTPALATIDLRPATAGAGTALQTAMALTNLTAAVTVVGVLVASHYITTSLLVIRVATAAGLTATARFVIEGIDVA